MLASALKNGSSIQRIVITSSCVAILHHLTEPITVSEADWNDAEVTECEKKGRDASGLHKYAASKTLAEKAAWDFYEKHKSEISWDISVLNPPWVFGPVIHEVTLDTLKSSAKFWYDAVVKYKFPEFQGSNPLITPGHGWVDVRDIAEAHVRALEVPGAGGQRIIISAGSHVWQDWFDVANCLTPPPYPSQRLPKGSPGAVQRAITLDTSKEKKILGIEFRTMEELARDTLADFGARGW